MSTDKITPVGEYILIKVAQEEETSDSGLILSSGAEPTNRGTIVMVGDKVNLDADSTKLKGMDTVIFMPGTGIQISTKDPSLQLVSVKNIIGIIKGDN